MDTIKKFGPSAVLAVAGMKAAELAGMTGWKALVASVAGALGGIVIASKI